MVIWRHQLRPPRVTQHLKSLLTQFCQLTAAPHSLQRLNQRLAWAATATGSNFKCGSESENELPAAWPATVKPTSAKQHQSQRSRRHSATTTMALVFTCFLFHMLLNVFPVSIASAMIVGSTANNSTLDGYLASQDALLKSDTSSSTQSPQYLIQQRADSSSAGNVVKNASSSSSLKTRDNLNSIRETKEKSNGGSNITESPEFSGPLPDNQNSTLAVSFSNTSNSAAAANESTSQKMSDGPAVGPTPIINHSQPPSFDKKTVVIIIILLCCCVIAFSINFINLHTDYLDLKDFYRGYMGR